MFFSISRLHKCLIRLHSHVICLFTRVTTCSLLQNFGLKPVFSSNALLSEQNLKQPTSGVREPLCTRKTCVSTTGLVYMVLVTQPRWRYEPCVIWRIIETL